MNVMKGMNPATVLAMAEELESCAATITTVSESILADVEALQWNGDDREKFRAEIASMKEEGLQLAQQIRGYGDLARDHVHEQQAASAA